MVKVAVAGATTGLGPVILDAILSTRKHDVVALSRNANPELSKKGVDICQVDYNHHSSLTTALQGIHTIISVISSFEPNNMRDAQLTLIEAAKEAGVKRFAPSEYALSTYDNLDLYAGKAAVWEALRVSGLEYTRFFCGIFMNTLGTGTPKGEAEALGGLRPWDFVLNIQAGTADLPGDGNAKVTFTRTQDIGRFVAAALDLDKWEEDMGMVGSMASYNEVIYAIEKVTGGRKMLVKKNSIRELEKMIEEEPAARFFNQVRLKLATGQGTVEPTLNGLFPEIKPLTFEEYLEKYWSGIELKEPAWAENNIIA